MNHAGRRCVILMRIGRRGRRTARDAYSSGRRSPGSRMMFRSAGGRMMIVMFLRLGLLGSTGRGCRFPVFQQGLCPSRKVHRFRDVLVGRVAHGEVLERARVCGEAIAVGERQGRMFPGGRAAQRGEGRAHRLTRLTRKTAIAEGGDGEGSRRGGRH